MTRSYWQGLGATVVGSIRGRVEKGRVESSFLPSVYSQTYMLYMKTWFENAHGSWILYQIDFFVGNWTTVFF